MRRIPFCLILLVLTMGTAFGQWQWQNPLPQGNALNSINMTDATHGWAVGKAGTIIRQNGAGWQNVASPTTENLSSVALADARHGWAVGEEGTFLRWNGQTWTKDPKFSSEYVWAVSAIDSARAWACGSYGYIFKFTNGQWTVDTSLNQTGNGIYFLNADLGWIACTQGVIYHTADGGRSWPQQTTPTSAVLRSVHFTDPTHGWAVGDSGTILRWNGSAWAKETSPVSITLNAVYFADSLHGWAAGAYGYILQYDSLGWHEVITRTYYPLYALAGTTDGQVWTVGAGGEIWQYNGAAWSDQSSNLNDAGVDLCLLDATHGWMVGDYGMIGMFNGTTWSPQVSGLTRWLGGVSFVDTTHGWAVGDSGYILRYNGSQWSRQASPTGEDLYRVRMVDTTHGWAVGANGTIIKYNGSQWVKEATSTDDIIRSVSMSGPNHGWAAGNDNTLLRYNGVSWTPFNLGYSMLYSIRAVYCVDSLHAWMIIDKGYNSSIYRFNGTSWVFEQTGDIFMGDYLYDLYFADTLHGWAVGKNGIVQRYDSTGWHALSTPNTNNLIAVNGLDAGHVWAAGSYGTVLYTTTDSSVSVGPSGRVTAAPRTSALSVQPNPCYASATLSYHLDAAAQVTAELYDLSGNRITTLFAGEQAAGNHTLDCLTENLPAGLYSVRLRVNGREETAVICKMR